MNKKYAFEVIVSKCSFSKNSNSWVVYDDVSRTELVGWQEYQVVESAQRTHVKKGYSVVVRPRFNDNSNGVFHEWRSFDGEELKRVEFSVNF